VTVELALRMAKLVSRCSLNPSLKIAQASSVGMACARRAQLTTTGSCAALSSASPSTFARPADITGGQHIGADPNAETLTSLRSLARDR
jgi:hypothetical protein